MHDRIIQGKTKSSLINMSKEKQKKELRNKSHFVESWLSDPEFSGWLHKEKEEAKARCSVCHKTIELSLSRCSALTDHAKGKKTQRNSIRGKNFFFFLPKNKAPHIVIEEPTNSVADGLQTLEDVLASTDSVRAEIIWTLRSVMSGYSVHSDDDLSLTFAAMFLKLKGHLTWPERKLYMLLPMDLLLF